MSGLFDATDVYMGIVRAEELGLSVCGVYFPLGDGRCSCNAVPCSSPGKHPIGSNWHRPDRVASAEAILRDGQPINIGIRTGAPSRAICIDVDAQHDGVEAWRSYEASRELGPLDATLKVLTPSGGFHLYYRVAPGTRVSNSCSSLMPGVDVRGDHGMAVIPPSRHANGGQYAFAPDSGSRIADLPADLYPRLQRSVVTMARRLAAAPSPTALIQRALPFAYDKIRHATHGTRNSTLYIHARNIGELVALGYLSCNASAQELVDAAVAAGLSGTEALATVTSAFVASAADYGISRDDVESQLPRLERR